MFEALDAKYAGVPSVARRTNHRVVTTLIRGIIGAGETPNQVEWALIDKLDGDVGCLVLLAVCTGIRRLGEVTTENGGSVVDNNIPAISLLTLRRRASILEKLCGER